MRKELLFGALLLAAPVMVMAQNAPADPTVDANASVDADAGATGNSVDANVSTNSTADANTTSDTPTTGAERERPKKSKTK